MFAYVWPNSLALQIIIGIIWFFAFIALCKCVNVKIRANRNLAILEELQDVSFLESVLKMNNVDVATSFLNYKESIRAKLQEKNGSLDDKTLAPLFDHLKAIYDAGHKSSRLDADLLVKNTVNKILAGVDTIRTTISLFLVIGILGTLVGLAISIGSFNGDGFIISTQSNNTAAELSTLFLNLKGAFAPSMWGVFCTIVFVAGFTFFIQEGAINRLSEKLTNSTINIWLPVLYPTDFQKGENTMAKIKDTLNQASGINTGAQDLLHNLTEANQTIAALKQTTEAVTASNATFIEGARKMDQLKNTLAQIHQQFEQQNAEITSHINDLAQETFKSSELINSQYAAQSEKLATIISNFSAENAKNNADLKAAYVEQAHQIDTLISSFSQASTANTVSIKESYVAQAAQLDNVINALKVYDDNYMKMHHSMQDTLQQCIDANIAATRSMEERESHLIRNITDPLRTQLTADLQNISANINAAAERLEMINNPLSEVKDEMSTMLENFGFGLKQMLAKIGQSAGLTQEERKGILAATEQHSQQSSRMETQLEAILKELQKGALRPAPATAAAALSPDAPAPAMTATSTDMPEEDIAAMPSESGKPGILSLIKKHLPLIIIAILLVMSIGVQGMMVSRLSSLEQQQSEITKVLQSNAETQARLNEVLANTAKTH